MDPQIQPPVSSVGSFPGKKVRTIDSLWTFLVATAVLGPFALPLLWRNPRYKWTTKAAGSVAVLVFTWALLRFAGTFMKDQLEQFEQLKAQMEQMQRQ